MTVIAEITCILIFVLNLWFGQIEGRVIVLHFVLFCSIQMLLMVITYLSYDMVVNISVSVTSCRHGGLLFIVV